MTLKIEEVAFLVKGECEEHGVWCSTVKLTEQLELIGLVPMT